jgi:hypothetical protein
MIRPFVAFARATARDLQPPRVGLGHPQANLDGAIRWLSRAHEVSGDGGVSYGYSLADAWRPSHPETSGFISVTLFDLAGRSGNVEHRARALDICRWLCRVQNGDGSFASPAHGSDGVVFDTGQALQGLARACCETGHAEFAEAANRAAHWLVQIAGSDGCWTRNTSLGLPHACNTRTAWPLLAYGSMRTNTDLERVARANLDWTVRQQRDTGWFDHEGFEAATAPFTHTLGYALEGLLEAACITGEPRYADAAFRGAEALLAHVRSDGFVPGQIAFTGHPVARFCCLTGNCQLAIVWAKLYKRSGDDRFRRAAVSSLRYVMASQDLHTDNHDVCGGIKGSHPVWGAYSPFTYPNWATKFFIDALLCCWSWL